MDILFHGLTEKIGFLIYFSSNPGRPMGRKDFRFKPGPMIMYNSVPLFRYSSPLNIF